jgi:peptide/nickel transport system substrate-binding protein
MKHKQIYIFIALLMALSLLMAACQPAAAPAVEEPVAEEEMAEEVMEEEMAWEPMMISQECGEGDYIKEFKAVDEMTVEFTLCKSDPAFLTKMAFTPFFIQPAEWIQENGGTGELLEKTVGTGPWVLEKWERGDSVTYTRFADYWGEPAKAEKLVYRWATESASRLLELQSGTVHYITNLGVDDLDIVKEDENLVLLPVPNPNTLYLAMTNTFDKWDDVRVRQAIAMGIDRQRIVDNFYPEGSEVASHFTPCTIPNGCDGDAWYDFDPDAAKALLADAGYPDGFETTIYYRDVFRVYLPEPGAVAVEFQTQLKENLNIDAEVVVMESGEFIDESTQGNLDGLYLLGWGADYMHVTNFLDFHFSRNNPQYGDPVPEIYELLEEAAVLLDPGDLYTQANNKIRELVPTVPIVHGAANNAAVASLDGAHGPPIGPPLFAKNTPADGDTIVFMQNAEPITVFCADITDGESLAACRQSTEGLYVLDEKGEVVPALAVSYESNEDGSHWTFTLREGVVFHDGSTLDANDVVVSLEAALDASSPLHTGDTGAFEYPAYLFGLMND